MIPTKSYRIWMSQRNGSTLLCKGLESTGIAGKPGEHFHNYNHKSLCDKLQVPTYEMLRAKLWELGTSENGVFGVKHTWMTNHHNKLSKEIAQLRGMDIASPLNHEAIFADLFPNCKHIYLTRRNKIRQAVSWWKAINDKVWHLEKGEVHKNEVAFYEEHYNFDALSHLFKEASLRECAIQGYFSRYNIIPLTFVYEDFIQDFEGTIRQIIDYLEIDYQQLNIGDFFYEKTATANSEIWVQRFRKDFQEHMDTVW